MNSAANYPPGMSNRDWDHVLGTCCFQAEAIDLCKVSGMPLETCDCLAHCADCHGYVEQTCICPNEENEDWMPL